MKYESEKTSRGKNFYLNSFTPTFRQLMSKYLNGKNMALPQNNNGLNLAQTLIKSRQTADKEEKISDFIFNQTKSLALQNQELLDTYGKRANYHYKELNNFFIESKVPKQSFLNEIGYKSSDKKKSVNNSNYKRINFRNSDCKMVTLPSIIGEYRNKRLLYIPKNKSNYLNTNKEIDTKRNKIQLNKHKTTEYSFDSNNQSKIDNNISFSEQSKKNSPLERNFSSEYFITECKLERNKTEKLYDVNKTNKKQKNFKDKILSKINLNKEKSIKFSVNTKKNKNILALYSLPSERNNRLFKINSQENIKKNKMPLIKTKGFFHFLLNIKEKSKIDHEKYIKYFNRNDYGCSSSKFTFDLLKKKYSQKKKPLK